MKQLDEENDEIAEKVEALLQEKGRLELELLQSDKPNSLMGTSFLYQKPALY